MMATIATAAMIVGLATGVLTLRDQLFPRGKEVPAAQQGAVTAATVAELSGDVQLGRFVELLGTPLSQERLQNDEWLVSRWQSPDIAVSAFSNGDSQVVAYMLTSLGPAYTPVIEYLRGGIRLRDSLFAEIPDGPAGIAGIYPPNGRFSYQELYLGSGASQYRSVVVAASYAANADDAAATELIELGCLPFSVFEYQQGCSLGALESLRTGLHVTSVTVGEEMTLQALAEDGALFFPEAD